MSTGPDLSHIAPGLRVLAKPIADLAFLVGNVVDHPEGQIEELKEALTRRGQIEPLYVNTRPSPPVVIGGNGRLQAMLQLGWTHAAWHGQDYDDAEAELIAAELNASSEGRQWNAAKFVAMRQRMEAAAVEMGPRMAERMEQLRAKMSPHEPQAQASTAAPTLTVYRIILTCRDEEQQGELLKRFADDGFEAKAG